MGIQPSSDSPAETEIVHSTDIGAVQDTTFNESAKTDKGTAMNVWGKIVLALRDSNSFILHAICGGMSDIVIEDNFVVVCTDNDSELDTINSNIDYLNDILKELGYTYKVKTRFVESPRIINLKNIKMLKSIFGDDIIVE